MKLVMRVDTKAVRRGNTISFESEELEVDVVKIVREPMHAYWSTKHQKWITRHAYWAHYRAHEREIDINGKSIAGQVQIKSIQRYNNPKWRAPKKWDMDGRLGVWVPEDGL